MSLGAACQSFCETSGLAFQEFVRRLVAERFQGGDTGGGRQRVAAEGAGLKDLSGGQDMLHDPAFSAEGRQGQATTDDFAHDSQIGIRLE